jgi:2-polyprenyl-3-methyl-5-hydroxy-6-metoxy-1,4-benzoquinol methylase
MAALGVQVLAFDLSQALIARAMARTTEHRELIEYRVLDATDEAALLALGERRFDAALCSMALFDMAEIDPLMRALARLLRPDGRFVFSVVHPCFNNPAAVHVAAMEDREGEIITTYSIEVRDYIHSTMKHAAAIRGQPRPQPVFHRPLQTLFGAAFAAGFVIDALEEPTFPPDHPQGRSVLGWGPNYASIPPVLIARVRQRG